MLSGSCTNLADLVEGGSTAAPNGGGMPTRRLSKVPRSEDSESAASGERQSRVILVSNALPLRAKAGAAGDKYAFEWDQDALVGQIKLGVTGDGTQAEPLTTAFAQKTVLFVGSLPVEVEDSEQERVYAEVYKKFGCVPVYIPSETKALFYKGFCKSILWPIMHYLTPLTPKCGRRFDRRMWQAYIAANKHFVNRVVEIINPDEDVVWIHDYHLVVLPTLLRKRFHALRIGYFLHCPFPSSEVFRALPCRDELLRSMLNADVIGFHTYDYARHFLSCISRALGVEHESKRGTIGVEYYGRRVTIRISPTGVNCSRLLQGFGWSECEWRRGELIAQFRGRTVALGVDDLDVFKGIDLKIEAVGRLLEAHPHLRGTFVLVQVVNAPRSLNAEVSELHDTIRELAADINCRYGEPIEESLWPNGVRPEDHLPPPSGSTAYRPIHLLERHVPLHERIALYSVADIFVVTCVRDGMNLFPYEYITCRQGPPLEGDDEYGTSLPALPVGSLGSIITNSAQGVPSAVIAAATAPQKQMPTPPPPRDSMLVVSEFVGCSPSLSGAMRVNPWNTDGMADSLHAAATMALAERRLRHKRHWEYVRGHTAQSWGATFLDELWNTTRGHGKIRCHGLGFGLHFRVVALDESFKKLDAFAVLQSYQHPSDGRRIILLDYDGTLTAGVTRAMQSSSMSSASASPTHHAANNRRPMTPLPPGGTMQTIQTKRGSTTGRGPPEEVLDMLRLLCADDRNVVGIISGRSRLELSHWFIPAGCPGCDGATGGESGDVSDPLNRLVLCAEHGIFYRYPNRGWQMVGMMADDDESAPGANAAATALAPPTTYGQVFHNASDGVDTTGIPGHDGASGWRSVALPVLRQYAECTDGAHVEAKETSLVWRYAHADPDFGGRQAKELIDHLEDVLAHDHSVEVVRGSGIVEVKPVEATKGACARRLINELAPNPGFCLCIGDDASDESMFVMLEELVSGSGELVTATVGSKPSRARYWVADPPEVLEVLTMLSVASSSQT